MYEIEATVTETGLTVLKLTTDWPVDWFQEPGIQKSGDSARTFHGGALDRPAVSAGRAEINGNRDNWPKLQVGNRVVVRCSFPGERTDH